MHLSRFFGIRHCETADRRQLMMGQLDGLAPLPTAISRIPIPLRTISHCFHSPPTASWSLFLCPLWLFHTSAKSTVSFDVVEGFSFLLSCINKFHCTARAIVADFACYNVHLSIGCYFGWQSPLLHSGQPFTFLIELLIVPWRSRASVRLFSSSAPTLASFRLPFAECR